MSVQSVLKSNFQFEVGANTGKVQAGAQGFVYILGASAVTQRKAEYKKIIESHSSDHQRSQLLQNEKRVSSFNGSNGPVWILQNTTFKRGQHQGLLDESSYAWFRDQCGSLVAQFKTQQLGNVTVNFLDVDETIGRAA